MSSALLGIIELLSKVALFSPQTVLCGSSCHFMSLIMFDIVRLFSYCQSGRCEMVSHLDLVFISLITG